MLMNRSQTGLWAAAVIAIAGGLVAAGLVGGPATGAGSRTAVLADEAGDGQRLEWGLYQILWSRRYKRILEAELSQFAGKPAYVMFYRDLGRRFPRRPINDIRSIDATPIISMELWLWHRGRKGSYLSAINAGEHDDYFRRWAGEAKRHGKEVLLRFGFEFNGEWFSWSGDPEAFKQAWRRAHGVFRAAGADNVKWVWAPNILSVPDKTENNMHLYDPGDDFVDWVALDGYNFGENYDKWHKWQSFDEIFAGALREFAKRYPSKPVMISETGCAPGVGEQRAEWIRAAYASVRKHPQVKAVIWFNYNKSREKELNWRIDVTPESLKAFNETFAQPSPSAPELGSPDGRRGSKPGVSSRP
jgi:hypothetical protein